jgi:hypothetical protein
MNERRNLSTDDIAGRGHEMREEGYVSSEQYLSGSSGAGMAREEEVAPLFTEQDADRFRSRWSEIQTGFVDEPRHAVEQADSLVAETIKRLAEIFSEERRQLEQQWEHGDNVSTEDLRLTLRRYRSFFTRLLSL